MPGIILYIMLCQQTLRFVYVANISVNWKYKYLTIKYWIDTSTDDLTGTR